MTGIGMLTLTGNTISMDVFGPVADNANGIGEMGYDAEAMDKEQPGSYKRARQILADLDAVGNTTKAETKASPSVPPSSPPFRFRLVHRRHCGGKRRQDQPDERQASILNRPASSPSLTRWCSSAS